MFLFICYEGLRAYGFAVIRFRSIYGAVLWKFTCQQITDKTKSVGYKHFLKTSDLTGDA